jgi:hypothetical protein
LRWGNIEHMTVERKCLKQGEWEGPTPFCIRKKLTLSEGLFEIISSF